MYISLSTASSFGTGVDEPLPNLTQISVYDVSDLSVSEKETQGSLVASGLNSTLTVNQQQTSKEYRFSFEITNEGDSVWEINDSDQLYHEGLNSSWTVNKIWYNISQDYDSGNFSNGKLEWNTSQGGTLDPGETMYAKYLVDISLDNSEFYSQYFLVNDTSNNTGSEDFHELDVNKLGSLDVTLEEPPNETVVTQNKTFVMNATVSCQNGECSEVDVSPRYNESSSADSVISENSGTPFYTLNQNTKTCSGDLKKDQSCQVEWDVNATGELESYHWLDVNASSSFNDISDVESDDNRVQINMAILINTSWDTTDFGLLDPGEQDQPAEGNSNLSYNITVPQESNTVDNLWIRATDLTSQLQPDNYSIGAGNLSYELDEKENLSNSYQNARSDIGPGTVLNMLFWIDVPTGIYKGGYNGTMYFKANSTR
jgi:hypothetical protein